MKFIVDAHLPKKLATYLQQKGYDAIHTLDLPAQNLTADPEVIRVSMQDQRVVISKDSDFYDSFVLRGQPHQLLMITTGNIVNKDLIAIFDRNLSQIIQLLSVHRVVEMDNAQLTVHF